MGNHAWVLLEIGLLAIIKPKKDRGGGSFSTSTKQEVKSYFRKFDTNGDGRLSFMELKKAFQMLGVKASFWEALRAINWADNNKDFCITEDELNVLAEFVLKEGLSVPRSFLA